ncbi:hypothetical protein LTR56_018585 [Elasticomyces elasticus]|nr:hypothetical protein LTR56_018585 [Elasticomyces elasticus]KAK3647387.1 hypothetical protein LTR22_013818 [Elasticomyces elasticus]KAK4917667.1 hypothetical protein LTR49_014489 [Elasticomyces elasticus]
MSNTSSNETLSSSVWKPANDRESYTSVIVYSAVCVQAIGLIGLMWFACYLACCVANNIWTAIKKVFDRAISGRATPVTQVVRETQAIHQATLETLLDTQILANNFHQSIDARITQLFGMRDDKTLEDTNLESRIKNVYAMQQADQRDEFQHTIDARAIQITDKLGTSLATFRCSIDDLVDARIKTYMQARNATDSDTFHRQISEIIDKDKEVRDAALDSRIKGVCQTEQQAQKSVVDQAIDSRVCSQIERFEDQQRSFRDSVGVLIETRTKHDRQAHEDKLHWIVKAHARYVEAKKEMDACRQPGMLSWKSGWTYGITNGHESAISRSGSWNQGSKKMIGRMRETSFDGDNKYADHGK